MFEIRTFQDYAYTILKSIARLKCVASIFECMNVEETIEAYSLLEPDVINLDFNLLGGNSMDIGE